MAQRGRVVRSESLAPTRVSSVFRSISSSSTSAATSSRSVLSVFLVLIAALDSSPPTPEGLLAYVPRICTA